MKYSFIGKIEKDDDNNSYIDLPFNIWEIFKKEGNVPAKVKVNGITFVCNLEPKGNGYYKIPIHPQIMEQFEAGKEYPVTFRITKYGVEDSPYCSANPIRHIDHIDCIHQPHDGLCGQSCVAMLAGITIDEASEVMHCAEWQATMDKIIGALNYFGLEHTEELIYTLGAPVVKLPKCCILLEKMGRYSHYLVYFDGKFYDPSLGVMESYDFDKLVGYLEVLVK